MSSNAKSLAKTPLVAFRASAMFRVKVEDMASSEIFRSWISSIPIKEAIWRSFMTSPLAASSVLMSLRNSVTRAALSPK